MLIILRPRAGCSRNLSTMHKAIPASGGPPENQVRYCLPPPQLLESFIMKNSDINITARTEGDSRVLTLHGRLTPEACELLRAALTSELEGGARNLIVILDEIESLTSCGVGTLIWTNQDCRDRDCQLMLVAGDDQVHRTLAAMGLERNLKIHRSITRALAPEEEQRRVLRRRITDLRRKKDDGNTP